MYRVEVDGHTIHDPRDEHFILPYAKVDVELNKTGSLELDITTENPGYEYINPMKSVITVYDDGKLIFRGRSTTEEKDFYNTGTLKCEGELSYLIDTILRPRTTGFINQTNRYIFREIIKEHNTQVGTEKQFQPGIIDIDEVKTDILSFNYETPLDFINANLIEKYKGYLRIRYADGKRYIDWVKQYGEVSQQEIRFGYNLLDLKKTLVSTDVCTVVVPVGGSDKKVTIKNAVVNGKTYGKDYLQNDEAVNYFGKIIKVQEFTDVVDPNTLYAEGEKWLLENMKSSLTVELTALDLHMVDANIDDFKLGDLVKVVSVPHSIVFKDDLPVIEKYSYDITDPSKNTITVGKTLKVFTERKDPVIYDKVQEVTGKFEGYVETTDGKIEEITNDIQEYKTLVIQDFTAVNGSIEQLTSKHADFETATAENFASTNAKISNLSGDFVSFKTGEFETLKAQQAAFENATAENFTAVRAEIDNILIGNLDADYARIDFANIDTAKIKQGFMENLMVSQGIFTSDITAAEGTFTNYLTGVNILANNITAGTLSVERLIITGSDQSVVYEINKANGTPQLSETTVDGGSLTERTITADRIAAGSITGNEIAATTITGQHIVANSITAASLDVNSIFAQDITATGTITGVNLIGATGSFSGNIAAATGTIGPWSIGNTSIWKGNSTFGNASGMYLGDSGFSITDKFKVTNTGELTAANVSLNGSIICSGKNYTTKIISDGIQVIDNSTGDKLLSVDGDYIRVDSLFINYMAVANSYQIRYWDSSAATTATSGIEYWLKNYCGYVVSPLNNNQTINAKTTTGASWSILQLSSANNTVVGHGGYANSAGDTNVYGNNVNLIPKGRIYGKGTLRMQSKNIDFEGEYGIYSATVGMMLRFYTSGSTKCTALGNNSYATRIYGSSVWSNKSISTSDVRYKEDFNTLESYEKMFMYLEPVTFRWKKDYEENDNRIHFGLKAQQVEEAFEKAGFDVAKYSIVEDYGTEKGLCYNDLLPTTIYMVQKTRKEIDCQIGKLNLQEAVINDLQSRLWQAEKEIKQLKQAVK